MKTNEKFYKAWWWLVENHLWAIKNLDIEVFKVNPKTRRIEDDKSKNTHVEIWLETGEYSEIEGKKVVSHNFEYDCGGDTFEEAIIKLKHLVKKQNA